MDTSPAPDPVKPRRWRRATVRCATLLASFYVGVIVLLLFFENALLYHPIKAATGWLDPPNPRVRDIDLHSADGTRLHAWWCPVEWGDGAVLYCHGNAGNLSHRGPGVAKLQALLHHSVLIFDYPGYGKSEGKPSEAGCYAAADAAYDWLTQQGGVPPEKLLIYGSSLGGGVAVDLASRRLHRALVLVSAFTSVPDMAQKLYPWLPGRWLVRNKFDNLGKIGRCEGPIFIAHGDQDRLVPLSQGERLFAAAPEPKHFHAMPGCDHNDGPDRAFYTDLQRFLASVEAQPARQTTR